MTKERLVDRVKGEFLDLMSEKSLTFKEAIWLDSLNLCNSQNYVPYLALIGYNLFLR
jgi:hypothetical protein